MIEIVAEKFKRLGCSFLEKMEVPSNKAWINGTYFYPFLFVFNLDFMFKISSFNLLKKERG